LDANDWGQQQSIPSNIKIGKGVHGQREKTQGQNQQSPRIEAKRVVTITGRQSEGSLSTFSGQLFGRRGGHPSVLLNAQRKTFLGEKSWPRPPLRKIRGNAEFVYALKLSRVQPKKRRKGPAKTKAVKVRYRHKPEENSSRATRGNNKMQSTWRTEKKILGRGNGGVP